MQEKVIKVRLSINENLNIIQFWCSGEDTQKLTFEDGIQHLYCRLNAGKKYRMVIYRSGIRNLADLTGDLLRRNISAIA